MNKPRLIDQIFGQLNALQCGPNSCMRHWQKKQRKDVANSVFDNCSYNVSQVNAITRPQCHEDQLDHTDDNAHYHQLCITASVKFITNGWNDVELEQNTPFENDTILQQRQNDGISRITKPAHHDNSATICSNKRIAR